MSKRFQNRISRISSRKFPQPKISQKKIWLAGSQPKKCVSWSLAIKKFGSGV